MPADQQKVSFFPDFKFGTIGEAVAGDHTLAGIRPEDKLVAVVGWTLAEAAPPTHTLLDLTSEFTISADNTLNNTGGTSLVNSVALVVYVDIPEDQVA